MSLEVDINARRPPPLFAVLKISHPTGTCASHSSAYVPQRPAAVLFLYRPATCSYGVP